MHSISGGTLDDVHFILRSSGCPLSPSLIVCEIGRKPRRPPIGCEFGQQQPSTTNRRRILLLAPSCQSTQGLTIVMAEELNAAPATLPKPDKRNVNLFDLTILVFSISARATQTLIDDATNDLPLAMKKLDMAERILPSDHPQRQKHIDAVANLEKFVSLGKELLAAITSEREGYIANMPEYSTGLFAQHNQTCVVRFLGLVNVACSKMKGTYPAKAGSAQFKILEGLQSHFECCR